MTVTVFGAPGGGGIFHVLSNLICIAILLVKAHSTPPHLREEETKAYKRVTFSKSQLLVDKRDVAAIV